VEYLIVSEVRARFDDDINELDDEAVLRRIDNLVAYLEEQLGHGFGRALVATSTGDHTVLVTDVALTIGEDVYAFADYPTLAALVAAVDGAGADYQLEPLPHVRPDTPSTLLVTQPAVTCGPTYSNRVSLRLRGLYILASGGRSHIFLPLPLSSITSVVENGVALDNTYYWATPGESWLIRKRCSATCDPTPRGCWSKRYPNNIAVSYVPQWWGRAPAPLKGALLDAFAAMSGLSPLQSENFVGAYSYTRATAPTFSWQDYLGTATIRRYAIHA